MPKRKVGIKKTQSYFTLYWEFVYKHFKVYYCDKSRFEIHIITYFYIIRELL